MSTDPVAVYYCFCEYLKNIVCAFPLCVVKNKTKQFMVFQHICSSVPTQKGNYTVV